MFTGLVQQVGRIESSVAQAQGRRLRIAAVFQEGDRALGASICVSGACLTVVEADAAGFCVDAAFETLAKTSLGERGAGDAVNLEASLRLGDPLGGHLVSGHVDGLASVDRMIERGASREVWFRVDPSLAPFIAAKGSVCLDGVSLTVNQVDGARFGVGIIPHTLQVTTLGTMRVGDTVNLEVDLLARYVARLLQAGLPTDAGLTMETLRAAGMAGPAAKKETQ